MLSGSSVEPDSTNNVNQTINIKASGVRLMQQLTDFKSVSALYPLFRGSVSAANGSVDSVCRSGCAFQPDARNLFMLMV